MEKGKFRKLVYKLGGQHSSHQASTIISLKKKKGYNCTDFTVRCTQYSTHVHGTGPGEEGAAYYKPTVNTETKASEL